MTNPPTEFDFWAHNTETLSDCSICLYPFTPSHPPLRFTGPTACPHIFGTPCLQTWCAASSQNANKCPICRRVLFEPPSEEQRRLMSESTPAAWAEQRIQIQLGMDQEIISSLEGTEGFGPWELEERVDMMASLERESRQSWAYVLEAGPGVVWYGDLVVDEGSVVRMEEGGTEWAGDMGEEGGNRSNVDYLDSTADRLATRGSLTATDSVSTADPPDLAVPGERTHVSDITEYLSSVSRRLDSSLEPQSVESSAIPGLDFPLNILSPIGSPSPPITHDLPTSTDSPTPPESHLLPSHIESALPIDTPFSMSTLCPLRISSPLRILSLDNHSSLATPSPSTTSSFLHSPNAPPHTPDPTPIISLPILPEPLKATLLRQLWFATAPSSLPPATSLFLIREHLGLTIDSVLEGAGYVQPFLVESGTVDAIAPYFSSMVGRRRVYDLPDSMRVWWVDVVGCVIGRG